MAPTNACAVAGVADPGAEGGGRLRSGFAVRPFAGVSDPGYSASVSATPLEFQRHGRSVSDTAGASATTLDFERQRRSFGDALERALVSVGMRPVPGPGRGDDRIHVREADFPAELALGLARIGVERGRVARAAGLLDDRHLAAGRFSIARMTSRFDVGSNATEPGEGTETAATIIGSTCKAAREFHAGASNRHGITRRPPTAKGSRSRPFPSRSWPKRRTFPSENGRSLTPTSRKSRMRLRPSERPATVTGLYMELVTIRYFKSRAIADRPCDRPDRSLASTFAAICHGPNGSMGFVGFELRRARPAARHQQRLFIGEQTGHRLLLLRTADRLQSGDRHRVSAVRHLDARICDGTTA